MAYDGTMPSPIEDTVLDLGSLRAARVAETPFPHLTLPDFVPAGALPGVIAGLPRLKSGGSFPVSALRLGPAAARLIAELEGPAFRDAIARLFGLDLAGAPVMTTLRGLCRERDGRIHTDSAAKRVTVLLYLNRAQAAWERRQGCLRLLRGPDDIEDYAEEVPPVDGTLLVFPNGPTAWHGHKSFSGPRYVVQMNYMADDREARHEMRRHRFSALVKRLVPSR